ncbi:MAG: hypothetical protein LUB61_06265, partial [Eggerthellaceae bacterium]|nr:hypothetical protein [Eggerthellaceae bacterium]
MPKANNDSSGKSRKGSKLAADSYGDIENNSKLRNAIAGTDEGIPRTLDDLGLSSSLQSLADESGLKIDAYGIFKKLFYERLLLNELTLPKYDWQNGSGLEYDDDYCSFLKLIADHSDTLKSDIVDKMNELYPCDNEVLYTGMATSFLPDLAHDTESTDLPSRSLYTNTRLCINDELLPVDYELQVDSATNQIDLVILADTLELRHGE